MPITNKLLKDYSPEDVKCVWNGIDITGFAPDTFVKVMRSVDAYTKTVGADGLVARTRSADRTGEVTITLMQNSLSNVLLAASAVAADNTGIGPVDNFVINDPSGSGLAVAFDCWVRKIPDIEYSGTYGTKTWTFDAAYVQIVPAS
jgi:hypothetical protein